MCNKRILCKFKTEKNDDVDTEKSNITKKNSVKYFSKQEEKLFKRK